MLAETRCRAANRARASTMRPSSSSSSTSASDRAWARTRGAPTSAANAPARRTARRAALDASTTHTIGPTASGTGAGRRISVAVEARGDIWITAWLAGGFFPIQPRPHTAGPRYGPDPVLEVTFAGWLATIGLIAGLFAIDLFVSRPGHAHTVEFREAALASIFFVSVAIAFGVVFGLVAGWDFGAEYFAGYIVEKSLSVDNLFVFVVILSTFAVPAEHQQRVLTFGILAALVMRAVFIALGAALISAFSFMFLIFGLLLIGTAVQLFRHRDQDPDIDDNVLVRITRRLIPVTSEYDDGRLVTRVEGRRLATPLFIALIAIGSSDLLFALDSIPAVFGVTDEPFIVFAANAYALLGLRALYFLVTGLLDRIVYLSTGLSLILAFIGVKLVLHYGHLQHDNVPEIATSTSLLVILVVLTVTGVASLLKARRDPQARAHAGTLREPREAPDA